ncbi:MAG: histidine phosphatase family protein [Desulfocapsaceae bacterium]|nr:histidine phosphatase family protein [Desulfocapsaceae bacterium]
MKRLFLIRHAKSSWSNLKITDFDRPLNKRGKQEAPLMAQRLAKQEVCPDALISSPAKRAKATAEIVARSVKYPVKQIYYLDSVYTSETKDLLRVLQKIDDRIETAFVVGHNYAITDLAVMLTSVYIAKIPTCGVVAMDLAVGKWAETGAGKGGLLFFDFPGKHEVEK